ncbi:MAG: flagellin FliC [Magnetococcales bacterium]|nr:flagellin FliC [Magnetococcales bacterium]
MAISIQDKGIQSLLGQSRQVQGNLTEAFRKLASGQSVSQGKDQAALLAVATTLTSQVRAINQATLNANDGVSLAQVAMGSLQEVQGNMERLRELAVQASSGGLNDTDRAALAEEARQLQTQIGTALAETRFNEIDLLSSNDSLTLQTGPNAGNQTPFALDDLASNLSAVDLSTRSGAESALGILDDNMARVSASQSRFGALEAELGSSINSLAHQGLSTQEARSGIMDADMASETARKVSLAIRQQAHVAMLSQANLLSQQVLSLL